MAKNIYTHIVWAAKKMAWQVYGTPAAHRWTSAHGRILCSCASPACSSAAHHRLSVETVQWIVQSGFHEGRGQLAGGHPETSGLANKTHFEG